MKQTLRRDIESPIPFMLLLLSLGTVLYWGAIAEAFPTYFASQGCAGCHAAPVVATCNGCHSHGTHPASAKNAINVTGTTNKNTYAPGELVTVTITGGYRTGWFRAVLYDQNMVELARSTGNDSGMGGSAVYPATLSATAPVTPGTFSWKVAWYGNLYDAIGATFGPGWSPDPNNPGHGSEIVTISAPFTVAAAPRPSSKIIPVAANNVITESSSNGR